MNDSNWRRWLIPGVIGILVGGCAALFLMRGAAQRSDRIASEVASTAESAAETAEFLSGTGVPAVGTPEFAIDPVIDATRQAYGSSLPAVATAARLYAEATVAALELAATVAALGVSDNPSSALSTAPADAPIAPLDAPAPPPGVTVDDFTALTEYARAAVPIVVLALETAERNVEDFRAAQGAPDTLCGEGSFPRSDLVSDADVLRQLLGDLESITPPHAADLPVHQPLAESMRLWMAALIEINGSCSVEQPIEQGAQRIAAAVRLGASVVSFQSARANFHSLLVEYGLQSLAGLLGTG